VKLVYNPSHQHGVVSENKDNGDYGKPTADKPFGFGSQFFKPRCDAALGLPAQTELYDEERDSNHKQTDEIKQDKGAPSVFPGYIGETPDVAKPDAPARSRQHKSKS